MWWRPWPAVSQRRVVQEICHSLWINQHSLKYAKEHGFGKHALLKALKHAPQKLTPSAINWIYIFKLIYNSQGMMPEESAQPGSGMHTLPWGQGCKISHLCWLCWIIKHKRLTQHFLSWPVSEVIEVTMYILTISVLMKLEAMLRISSLAPLERLLDLNTACVLWNSSLWGVQEPRDCCWSWDQRKPGPSSWQW